MARKHRCGTIVLEKGLGKPLSQQAVELLGKDAVRADAAASRPPCRDRGAGGLGGVFLGHRKPRIRCPRRLRAGNGDRQTRHCPSGRNKGRPAGEGCFSRLWKNGRSPPTVRGMRSAAGTPTCRSALGVPMSTGRKCSVGMRSSALASASRTSVPTDICQAGRSSSDLYQCGRVPCAHVST